MAGTNPGKTLDAIALLEQDHKMVEELFDEFKRFQENETEGVDDLKQELMDEVCKALTVHAQIEEEIFYPPVRAALDEEDLMNEARVEHEGAKELIAKIKAGSASDPVTCARFLVLSEQIDHHVKEEREEMFPKVRKTDLDLVALGRELKARKDELEGRIGNPPRPLDKGTLLERLLMRRA